MIQTVLKILKTIPVKAQGWKPIKGRDHNLATEFAMFEKAFWITGGACTGKSTLASALCERLGYRMIDMDARIYGTWQSAYNANTYPENYQWSQQSNALEWALLQSDEEYLGFCERASQEYFQLLEVELNSQENQVEAIVDGGFSSLIPWVGNLDKAKVICLDVEREIAISEWNTHPDRVTFKQEIQALPFGEKKWIRFLELDALITSQLVKQAKGCGIAIIDARRVGSLDQLVEQVMGFWGVS